MSEQKQKKAVVFGATGFIGGHLVERLKQEGYYVVGVDIQPLRHREYSSMDKFYLYDLQDPSKYDEILGNDTDELYQLCALMGGAGFVFTGDNDADIMHNSALVNLHTAKYAVKLGVKKVFYSSSACIYPEYNQMDSDNPKCSEESAYPAQPDSLYGMEKLFSENLYLSFRRNKNLNVRIARFHNIFGPYGSWNDGKEKAPAAMTRKAITTKDNGEVEIWGDGEQTRSFLYIDDCINAIRLLMNHPTFYGPVNIGSEEMITINNLMYMASNIARKNVNIKHISGPLGVRGRNSHNRLIEEKLGWKPKYSLRQGMEMLFPWIEGEYQKQQI
jgi:GDP-D-mannose 3', 5'-epimerase